MKIAVGMSGGVDSSVAAAVLKEQGHEVVGVTMSIWRGAAPAADQPPSTRRHACYGPGEEEEIATARSVAKRIGIPFQLFDCAEQYERLVLDYFKNEYALGRTPNPCVRCNQLVKLGLLPELARQSGLAFDAFATGHYARIGRDEASGRWLLKKALDEKKDQSYFLYRLTQKQLSFLQFPLGELSKTAVRELARRHGLEVSEREESQDFYCGDYSELLGFGEREGPIVNVAGKVLGQHKGFWRFTPGQRKGLRVPGKVPYYVVRVDADTNTVVVGSIDEARHKSFIVNDIIWSAIERLASVEDYGVKIRSTGRERDAVVEPLDAAKVRVTLLDEGEAVPPGQSAVFYLGDIVVGGGVIEELL